MSGNMLESKNAKFNIWRTENNVIIPDVGFSLSLNHSRLLSSSLEWRIDLKDNIVVIKIYYYQIHYIIIYKKYSTDNLIINNTL